MPCTVSVESTEGTSTALDEAVETMRSNGCSLRPKRLYHSGSSPVAIKSFAPIFMASSFLRGEWLITVTSQPIATAKSTA